MAQKIDDALQDLGNAVLQAKMGSLSYLDRENYRDFVPPYLELVGVSKTVSLLDIPNLSTYNSRAHTYALTPISTKEAHGMELRMRCYR